MRTCSRTWGGAKAGLGCRRDAGRRTSGTPPPAPSTRGGRRARGPSCPSGAPPAGVGGLAVPTHLAVEGEEPEAADGREEEEWDGDLDDVGGHHAELLEPDGQLVGEPGARRGDALGLIVIGESWGGTGGVGVQRGARGRGLERAGPAPSRAERGRGAGSSRPEPRGCLRGTGSPAAQCPHSPGPPQSQRPPEAGAGPDL